VLQNLLQLFISEVDGDFVSPLSKYPSKLGRFSDIKLLGNTRKPIYDQIISNNDDLLLVGPPGIGKTFILQKTIENENILAYFASNESKYNLSRAIRIISPDCVFVDDAHRKIDLLAKLFQIRAIFRYQFRIIATSWPTEDLSRVKQAGYFKENQIIYLKQFTKDDLANLLEMIITEEKITRQYDWEQLIIDYSNGLPGLAVTLLDTCIKTGGKEVFEGKSILTFLADISLETRSTIDWIKTKKILAWISLFGRSGIRLTQLSQILDIPIIEILSFLNSYQYSGIITEEQGRFWVRPKALRAVLVKEDLFNQDQFYNFLDSSTSVNLFLDVILDAIRIGGSIPSNYLYSLLAKTTNDDLWQRFYFLFPESIDQGIKEFPNTTEASIEPGLHNTPEMMLPIVFEIASQDKRPLHSSPDHVLRKLENWLQFNPTSKETIIKRKLVLKSLTQFANSDCDPETVVKVICLVLSPNYEVTEIPPGSGYKINFGRGIYSINLLKQFHEFWGQAYILLSNLPTRFLGDFIDSLYVWTQPSMVVHELSSDFITNMQEIAERFIYDVGQISKNHPDILRQLSKLYIHFNKEPDIEIKISPEILRIYDTLFPETDEYLKRDHNEEDHSINDLAKEFLSQDTESVLEIIIWVKTEAYLTHDPYPDLLPHLFSLISQEAADPLKWYRIMAQKDLTNYTLPFINQAIFRQVVGWEDIIHEMFNQEETIPLALEIVLNLDNPTGDLLKILLEKINEINPNCIRTLCSRNQVSESVTRHLLNHESEKISLAAAIGEWWRDPHKEVRERLHKEWDKIISETRVFDYSLLEIFKEYPRFAFDWVSKAYFSLSDGFAHTEEKLIEDSISLLTNEDRKKLLKLVINHNSQRIFEINQVKKIINNSIPLYKYLLELSTISDHLFYILSPLNQLPNKDKWVEMILLASKYGVSNEDILAAAFQPQFQVARIGELSHQYQEYVVAFEQLSQYDNETIKDIAKRGLEKAKRKVIFYKERESNREIYGWD